MLGRVVTCGVLGGDNVETNMRAFNLKHFSLLRSRAAPMSQVQDVYRLAGERKLQPVIDRCMSLAKAAAAHTLVEERSVFGRGVLTVN